MYKGKKRDIGKRSIYKLCFRPLSIGTRRLSTSEKNQLSKEQTKLNEALADKYNPDGKFPYTILVDEHGKVLKDWDGFPNESPDQFVAQIAGTTPVAN